MNASSLPKPFADLRWSESHRCCWVRASRCRSAFASDSWSCWTARMERDKRRPERDKSPTPPPAAPNAERPMLRLDPALGRAK